MTTLRFIFTFIIIAGSSLAGITEKYSTTITTPKGFTFTMEPITLDEKYLKDKGTVVKEPSNAKYMRDGKPWPDRIINNMHLVYAANWETFDDLRKIGIKTSKPLTLAFVIYDEKGNLVGDAGIQTVRRGLEPEIFFNVMPDFRRKGVAMAASKYLIEFYKTHFTGDKIAATAMPNNVASRTLLKKLGMQPKCDAKGKQMVYTHPEYNTSFDIFIMPIR